MTWLADRFRNLRYGLRNLWLFRREVWRWRGWDYEYDYELFVRGLRLTADHIERHQIITAADEVARNIRHAADTWVAYSEGPIDDLMAGNIGPLEWHEMEQNAWRQFHDFCREYARGWWD